MGKYFSRQAKASAPAVDSPALPRLQSLRDREPDGCEFLKPR